MMEWRGRWRSVLEGPFFVPHPTVLGHGYMHWGGRGEQDRAGVFCSIKA